MNRALELALALVLAVCLLPVMLAVAVLILVADGPPVFYRAQRVKAGGRIFALWKFRTMRAGAGDGVAGGDAAGRITALGRVLRRHRLDELPQLINLIRGDIGFVGPRPPLPRYVARAPALYAEVLRVRPGVTGLATLIFSAREAAMLARARTAEETDAIYVRRCIPRKARLDRLYARRRTVLGDAWLIALTAARVLGPRRGRLWRRRRRT